MSAGTCRRRCALARTRRAVARLAVRGGAQARRAARAASAPKDEVIFETGYGPSGLPHIGTFGEVARTTMVRHAFQVLTEGQRKTRLICFSDDMDGLRKVPDNVPNKEMLAAASRQAADRGARSVQQRVSELRRAQQRAAARASSIASASSTSSCRRPSATSPAGSTRRCCTMLRALRRGDGDHAADAGRGAARRPTRRSCRSRPDRQGAAGADGRARRQGRHHRLSRSEDGDAVETPVTGGHVKCSGRPTGRCAGPRSASTTRCPART